LFKSSLLKFERPSPIALTHNKSSSVMPCWHMRRLSPQSLKTKFDCHRAQRAFKSYTSLACVRALSPKSKRPSPIIPRIASLQEPHLVGMCKTSSLKVKRLSPITLTHNESSTVMSRWHMQGLSPQSLKTEPSCHRAQRVFKCYTSLTCVGDLSSKSKDRV